MEILGGMTLHPDPPLHPLLETTTGVAGPDGSLMIPSAIPSSSVVGSPSVIVKDTVVTVSSTVPARGPVVKVWVPKVTSELMSA